MENTGMKWKTLGRKLESGKFGKQDRNVENGYCDCQNNNLTEIVTVITVTPGFRYYICLNRWV